MISFRKLYLFCEVGETISLKIFLKSIELPSLFLGWPSVLRPDSGGVTGKSCLSKTDLSTAQDFSVSPVWVFGSVLWVVAVRLPSKSVSWLVGFVYLF
jgi:hypothetical protein